MTSPVGHIVTITSGMRDAGKYNNTVKIGLALARLGKRVCIVNTDRRYPKSNELRHVPVHTLEHVVNGNKPVQEILPGKDKSSLAPSGAYSFNPVYKINSQPQCAVDAVISLQGSFDYVLIDTAACIDNLVLKYIKESHKSLFVISSDPESLADSYSLLKFLFNRKIHIKTDIVVNYSQNENHAMNVFSSFSSAVKKYMNHRMDYLGCIISENCNTSSVCFQDPLLLKSRGEKFGECFRSIALNLHKSLDESCEIVGQNHSSYKENQLTMKILADKYQRIFRTMPFKELSGELKDDNQALAIRSLKLKDSAKEAIHGENCVDPEWQDYLGGIHLASLLGDYADATHGGSC